MPTDLDTVKTWIDNHGTDVGAAFGAAVELYGALKPLAATQGISIQGLLTGDPVADRAIADAVGVAAIAGRRGLTVDQVLDAAAMLGKLALTLVALA